MSEEIVITGMGAVSPFGFGVKVLWNSLVNGQNGISALDPSKYKGEIVKVAGQLPVAKDADIPTPKAGLFSKEPEDSSVKSFMLGVHEAIEQSGIVLNNLDKSNAGVFIADRILNPTVYIEQYLPSLQKVILRGGSMDNTELRNLLLSLPVQSPKKFDESVTINHQVARRLGITGPQLSISNACASGNSSLIEAMAHIQNNELDIVIAGGAYNFDMAALIGFTRLGALTMNSCPDKACRPFDFNRDGFVLSSGCGILILESLEHAKNRGATPLGKISGYGYYTDAYRSTDPDPEAVSCVKTIETALSMARLNKSDIDYINAHGTSTKMNDLSEGNAIRKVFRDNAVHIPISSTKSMIGHTILAAGALEAIVAMKSLEHGIIHPTRNYKNIDPELVLDFVPNEARKLNVEHVLSNSFGFGGLNTSIIFSKV